MKPEPRGFEKFAFGATRNVGSPTSLIIHTALFAGIFLLNPLLAWSIDKILLVLTTIVSLEAIYLAIFIQLTLNHNTARLSEVSEDVEEIQEDVGEIQEDVEELSEDVEEITEEMEEDEKEEDTKHQENRIAIEKVENAIMKVLKDLDDLKTKVQK